MCINSCYPLKSLQPLKPLKEMLRDYNLSLHLRHSTIEDSVSVYGGIIASDGRLVNNGDFISTSDPTVSCTN